MAFFKIKDPATGQWVNLPLLKGDKGEKGDTGAKGDKGDPGEVTQAELDAVTSQLAEKALQTHLTEKTGYGVVSGLGVTAQSTPDMSVSVAAGTGYRADGTRFNFPSAVTLPATAADATNPRIDIVYVSTAGVRTYLAGTAAATPAAPATPTGGTLLAEISVAAEATTILTADIKARKKGLLTDDWIYPTLRNGWSGTARYKRDTDGSVWVEYVLTGGTSAYFALAVGYRPASDTVVPTISNISSAASTIVYASNGAISAHGGSLDMPRRGCFSFKTA